MLIIFKTITDSKGLYVAPRSTSDGSLVAYFSINTGKYGDGGTELRFCENDERETPYIQWKYNIEGEIDAYIPD